MSTTKPRKATKNSAIEAPRRGRPRSPEGTARNGPGSQLQIRVSPAERAAWHAEATRDGRELANWIRWCCNARAGFVPGRDD